IMSLKGRKGMEVEVEGKGLKRLRKGTKGASSSTAKAISSKHFRVQEEDKYAPENWIDEGYPALEFPAIRDKLWE
ncbi:hypothetical protein HAX54_014720, partial [Datura stramonium]|nr:hypothetical protein [Datura stramonium]